MGGYRAVYAHAPIAASGCSHSAVTVTMAAVTPNDSARAFFIIRHLIMTEHVDAKY